MLDSLPLLTRYPQVPCYTASKHIAVPFFFFPQEREKAVFYRFSDAVPRPALDVASEF